MEKIALVHHIEESDIILNKILKLVQKISEWLINYENTNVS